MHIEHLLDVYYMLEALILQREVGSYQSWNETDDRTNKQIFLSSDHVSDALISFRSVFYSLLFHTFSAAATSATAVFVSISTVTPCIPDIGKTNPKFLC